MIVAGFGFNSQAKVTSFQDALMRAKEVAERSDIDAISCINNKSQHIEFKHFIIDCECNFIDVDIIKAQSQTTQTQSNASMNAYGVGSLAEATALAACGANARLLTARVISDDGFATCALAQCG